MLVVSLFEGCSIEIDPSITDSTFATNALKFEYITVLISLLGGLSCIIAGVVLTILGFSGSIDWIIEVSGFTSRLINACPGIILIIVGAFLIYKSRINVKSISKDNTSGS